MEKLDEDSAAKFINALIKSLQTLCHGYLEFNNGIEIIGHINLNVDKGSSMHYILEEKVCKNEENSTLFISNSFHAQNQKSDSKSKGKDSDAQLRNRNEETTSSPDLGEAGKLSAISSISSALSKSHEKNRSGSTSSVKESENLHSKPLSSTAKRKGSDDHSNDVRAAKSSHLSSSPSPVSHFLSQSPHDPSGSSSPVDTKPSLRQIHAEDSSGTVLPQTAAVTSDSAGDLGVNLAGSVLERVDDQSNSDLPDRGEDSDGDLEVTFIKEEYVEGEQSACQFENSGGQQYGRGTHQRASSSDMSDGSMYPVSLHHSQSASSTFVPSAHDISAAQHYGPSTSSQPQPGTSGVRGAYPPESHDSSACDQKILEATQLFKEMVPQYKSNRGRYCGFKVDYSNYKILKFSDPMPEGYQWLVEGCPVAVPVSWLHSVLDQCQTRSPSFVLTMITSGMLRPHEVIHGGTSAYAGTYMEPVINALKCNLSQHQPPQPVPEGVRPGCGYVHPSDAQKWMGLRNQRYRPPQLTDEEYDRLLELLMKPVSERAKTKSDDRLYRKMYELVPGSGVFIHEENYHNVMSKQRDGQPDGKAMARYLMSCFWKQSDLVGASIAEPPRPHHRSLDKGIINAILEYCELNSLEARPALRRVLWSKITKATTSFRRSRGIPPLPNLGRPPKLR